MKLLAASSTAIS